jgi:hypothetical protein
LPLGYLPAGTNLLLGDLDSIENWTPITACAVGGGTVASHWLTDTVYAQGRVADLLPQFMPSWTFNGAGLYTFTGESATGNPAFTIYIQTAVNITSLQVARDNVSNSLDFRSGQVPEPSTWAMLGSAVLILGIRRQRSTWNTRS